ncbi:class I SAM-dependent methyltransferase [Shewanella pneumatophori]|uniref:Class I SAM-dependent methyltransferase n=1 Tax=Shewanella pneumatophori TaxID=314092 RepID=A0A9X2CJP1_9GAMM|nr:class I SAM-dependent methyltransferase [Shewanella pneumatophori]MCL1140704.1 class I SAM-dependent methyltransferase [Shewanella pneumatophori]
MQLFIEAVKQVEFPHDVTRLFHGRGGRFAGCEHLCMDWFAPVVLLTSFKVLETSELDSLCAAIEQRWLEVKGDEPLNLVFQYRRGGETHTEIIKGEVPEKHLVTENGACFQVHLMRGQNHGLFLDMANGRQWVREHSAHKKVLNLFAYTCGFSVAALQGKADEVVNIDMSKGALSIGKQNHILNDFKSGARFLGHDIFKSWGKLTKLGPYEVIVADPPSNQKGSFVATKDYARLLKRLPELLTDDGDMLLCLNAPELSIDFLKQQVDEFSPDLVFCEQLANPAVFADVDPNKALKVLRYRKRV